VFPKEQAHKYIGTLTGQQGTPLREPGDGEPGFDPEQWEQEQTEQWEQEFDLDEPEGPEMSA
jgi:hypothetical protein